MKEAQRLCVSLLPAEALDPHLKTGGAVLNSQLPIMQRLKAGFKAIGFYAIWYPKMWLPANVDTEGLDPRLAKHVRYAARSSKRLARALFHAMVKHQARLEQEQMVLKEIVDIGAELFALSAACSRAEQMHKDENATGVIELADTFCKEAKLKIAQSFSKLKKNNNKGKLQACPSYPE